MVASLTARRPGQRNRVGGCGLEQGERNLHAPPQLTQTEPRRRRGLAVRIIRAGLRCIRLVDAILRRASFPSIVRGVRDRTLYTGTQRFTRGTPRGWRGPRRHARPHRQRGKAGFAPRAWRLLRGQRRAPAGRPNGGAAAGGRGAEPVAGVRSAAAPRQPKVQGRVQEIVVRRRVARSLRAGRGPGLRVHPRHVQQSVGGSLRRQARHEGLHVLGALGVHVLQGQGAGRPLQGARGLPEAPPRARPGPAGSGVHRGRCLVHRRLNLLLHLLRAARDLLVHVQRVWRARQDRRGPTALGN